MDDDNVTGTCWVGEMCFFVAKMAATDANR
jgi:hypothetical protein